ncbi:hypothetical protein MUP05_06515, partial [Candidatus Bathyarchaeota archaeon]|nr:hypothetical protein [Candidatus Bathyarchaeota archaeon]
KDDSFHFPLADFLKQDGQSCSLPYGYGSRVYAPQNEQGTFGNFEFTSSAPPLSRKGSQVTSESSELGTTFLFQ